MNAPMKQAPQNDAVALLNDPNMISQIARALPKHFAPDRMIRIVLTELRKVPKLTQCDPITLIACVMQCAQLGLEPGSGLGHVYLIPYGRVCTMIVGYKGYVELMRRSGTVSSIYAELVRDGDKFSYGVKDGRPFLDWSPGPRIKLVDEEITHAFAIGTFKGGDSQNTVMFRSEVDAIRDASLKKAFKPEESPWKKFYGEMAKKTAIRRLSKMMPQSPEFVRIQELDDAHDDSAISQMQLTLQPLVEAGVVDSNYDPEPEKQAPLETPADKERKAATRAELVAEFGAAYNTAKLKGLKLGDELKLFGMEAEKVRNAPTDEIENATDILNDYIKQQSKGNK